MFLGLFLAKIKHKKKERVQTALSIILLVRWISLVCSRLPCVSLSPLRALFHRARDWGSSAPRPTRFCNVLLSFVALFCCRRPSGALPSRVRRVAFPPARSSWVRPCRRETPGGVMQEVRNATSSAPAASPTTGRRVPASFATARRPLGRRHAQVSCVREYLIPRVAARDLRPTSIREDDSYNAASTGDLASDHGPFPSPREATTRPSPGETRRIFAKTTTHRRRRRPRCTCSGHGNVQQRRQLSSF